MATAGICAEIDKIKIAQEVTAVTGAVTDGICAAITGAWNGIAGICVAIVAKRAAVVTIEEVKTEVVNVTMANGARV